MLLSELFHHKTFLVQIVAQLFIRICRHFLAKWHFLTDVYFEISSKHLLVNHTLVLVVSVAISGHVLKVRFLLKLLTQSLVGSYSFIQLLQSRSRAFHIAQGRLVCSYFILHVVFIQTFVSFGFFCVNHVGYLVVVL